MNYFEVYKDVWNFHKRYSEILDTDEYWENVVHEYGEIASKYDDAQFAIDLLLAVVNELSRKAKEVRWGAEAQIPDGTVKKAG